MPSSTNKRKDLEFVKEVLSPQRYREIWTADYKKALPVSIQGFEMSSVLPAMFYMFRFGHRRGQGFFTSTYGGDEGKTAERRSVATITNISGILSETKGFQGFDGEDKQATQAILGDLLLCYGLENLDRKPGRDVQVQRASPSHYMSSWIDLPDSSQHLRAVPEMLVAMVRDKSGEVVVPDLDDQKTFFPIGKRLDENELVKHFYSGMSIKAMGSEPPADYFQEDISLGLDQLLMLRLAQVMKAPPRPIPGRKAREISNQRPIAEKASEEFTEDFKNFIRYYGGSVPRQTFVELLETGMAVGLTTIVSSVVNILNKWMITGEIIPRHEQVPVPIFVDCSNGSIRRLRELSEKSFDDVHRRSENLPKTFMTMRILDQAARLDPDLRKASLETTPYATEWLNLLGEVLKGNHPSHQGIAYDLRTKCVLLSELLELEFPDTAKILVDETIEDDPVLRLSDALIHMMGHGHTIGNLNKLWESVLMIGQHNGLARKRSKSIRSTSTRSGRSTRVARSLIFTDSALDYLAHLHMLKAGKPLTLKRISLESFIAALRDRHGIYVDESPEGSNISNENLQLNRSILERRLRDLGLLQGVNDAESMKRLRPRFQSGEVL